MTEECGRHFIGEALRPEAATSDTTRMASGEPGLPLRFTWRGGTLEIAGVLRAWKDTGPCRHGSGERYVRKHWYEVTTSGGQRATLYFERQPRGRARSPRWWLFSLQDP